ncbi:MAG TPA: glycosyltransferase, partial [Gemmatimonadaceae bacterium]|nr:glycosyltransferase [Gemmatimonadaceae bacterium]
PFVSVIIPTYNRSWRLKAAVESFLAQDYPRDRYEIILSDNDSTDDTRDVIATLASELEIVRGIHERRRGAHFARNTAARAANGDVLYFTDDDMIASPDLLRTIVTGFELDPKVAVVTGRVVPRWETEPPRWILEYCQNALLSLNDLGDATIVSDTDPGVFSCHEAIRRDVFFHAGGFNPDTNAGEFTGDNETGLNIKVRALGYRFAYVGLARIQHVIPASRMTQEYLNSRFADQGYCDSYTAYREGPLARTRLVRRVMGHTVLAGISTAKAAARRALNDSRWRMDLARVFYYRNRARYDTRLIRHDKWRQFVMRSNWIDGDSDAPSAIPERAQ